MPRAWAIAHVETATAVGEPAHEILAFAKEQHTDLVVLGTHGRTGIAARADGIGGRAGGSPLHLPGADRPARGLTLVPRPRHEAWFGEPHLSPRQGDGGSMGVANRERRPYTRRGRSARFAFL